MRQHLTLTEAVFAVASLVSITLLAALDKLSADGFAFGLGLIVSYSVGKANGYKRYSALNEASSDEDVSVS